MSGGTEREAARRPAERAPREAQGAATRPPPRASPARHCLVSGLPGLLVEWLRTERGWEGRVVTVAWIEGPAGPGWAVVERWVPAAAIVPVA